MEAELTKTKVLKQAVALFERLYYGRDHGQTLASGRLPHADLAFRIALKSAISQQRGTCFLSDHFSPSEAAFHMMCLEGRTSMDAVRSQKLEQMDFNRLTHAICKLASSPIHFARHDPRRTDETIETLWHLNQAEQVEVVVSETRRDDGLDAWRSKLEAFSRLAGASVHLVAARLPAAGPFIPAFRRKG